MEKLTRQSFRNRTINSVFIEAINTLIDENEKLREELEGKADKRKPKSKGKDNG